MMRISTLEVWVRWPESFEEVNEGRRDQEELVSHHGTSSAQLKQEKRLAFRHDREKTNERWHLPHSLSGWVRV